MDNTFNPNEGYDSDRMNDSNENMEQPSKSSDSLYSYNYRDKEQNSAAHEGDYDARRDDVTKRQENIYRNAQTYTQGTSQNYTQGASQNYTQGTSQSYTQGASQSYTQGASQNYTQGASQSYAQGTSYKNPQDTYYRAASETEPSDGKKKRGIRFKAHRGGSTSGKKKSFGMAVVKCAVLAAVFGLVAGGIFQGVAHIGGGSTQNAITGTPTSTGSGSVDKTQVSTAVTVKDVSDIVENVMPSIVSITSMSQTEYYNMFGQSQTYEGESAGSGIIVAEDDENLYIATNNHVVQGSSSLTVCFVDNETVSAQIKGTDPSSDLAVVSVSKSSMKSDTLSSIKIATLGDSSDLEVGESAVAIGNALGYGQSVTTGVISALNREVSTTDSSTGTTVTNELIQTDAAINPGNSGGALLNMNGEVIGINSVKYSDTTVEGMGYAIPISNAQPIIDELITREKVDASKSAYLGISGVDVSSDVAQTYNMPEGVYVAQVSEGSAAQQAGIVKGDIITEFDGHKVASMETLKERLEYYEAGTEVEVKVQRTNNGAYEEMTINVTLGSKTQ